ncbi:MAG: class I SAM-dependent methyltransferase [Acidimicrobiales bacterium]
MTPTAAETWATALAEWAIPDHIVANAPEPPWYFPPELFARIAKEALATVEISPSRRQATAALPDRGSVLDVGAGGGAASLPLAPPAALLVGLDPSQGMLDVFAAAADERGIAHREVLGDWPDAADQVEPVDVVVCHNVLYNVGDLGPFVQALTRCARRRVVVEITAEHPTSNMSPLWKAIHGIDRPTRPTADGALAVLAESGIVAHHEVFDRRWPSPMTERSEAVAFARRRLCVGPDRDREIDALLTPEISQPTRQVYAIWWDV